MITKKSICLIVGLAFGIGMAVACHNSKTAVRELHLREVLSIGGIDQDVLSQWIGVVVDGQDNLFVTDDLDFSIKKFDAKGNLIKKAGRKGQAPGEFSAPRYVGCSEKLVYVTDQYRPGIQIFDNDLVYQGNIDFAYPIHELMVQPDDSLVFLASGHGGESRLITMSARGEIIQEISCARGETSLMMNDANFDVDKNGCFYLAYNFQDRIEKIDNKGKILWSTSLLGGKKVEPENKFGLKLPTYFIYKGIALNQKGDIFVLGGSLSIHKSRDIYVLDGDGNMTATMTLPEATHCIYLDHKDYLYTRADEGLTIKKMLVENR